MPTFWNTIEALANPVPQAVKEAEQQRKDGELVIVGSGIASVRQMTVEVFVDFSTNEAWSILIG